MKKLFLLITALLTLGVSGAWADVTQPTLTTDPAHPYYYIIKNSRSNKYATYTGASSQLSQVATPTAASVWYFVENGSGVSIVPASAPTLKLATHSSATAAGAVWYLVENPYQSGYFCVSLKSDLSANCWDDQGSHTTIGYYNPRSDDANGTSWTIEEASDYNPSLPVGNFLSVGEKTNSFTVSSSASDNAHWYLITQNRLNDQNDDTGDDTPVYNVSLGSTLKRAGSSITPSTLNNSSLELIKQYLVRFISAGEGLYNIQFADGNFIDATLKTTPIKSQAGTYAFYNTVAEGTTFGWNLTSNTGDIVDNNGQNGTVVFWSTGTVAGTSGNNKWSIYPVSFTDALSISYSFNTSNGAFFQSLTTNKAPANDVYCNLWLSKNAADKPQLKLITNNATTSGGNNIRSNGALFTTDGDYSYNLSVSEGKIKSYTIIGTTTGALSITPSGGEAENFAESSSVSKKVTLASSAKQTSFTLHKGDGVTDKDKKFLIVDRILIEWETDATIVSSVSGITNDGIYTLEPHNAERGVLYAGTSYLDACGGDANTNYPANPAVAIDATDANQQFAFYTYNGNTYLYNLGRGKFVGTASDVYYQLTNTPTNKWTVSNGAYTNYFHLTSKADSKMATINAWIAATATMKGTQISGGKDYGVTGTTANEEANNFYIHRVGTLTNEQMTAIEGIIADYETLMTNLELLDKYTIGTGLGEYTNEDFTDEAFKDANIESIRAAVGNYNASTLSGVKSSSQSSISKMVINPLSSGSLIRVKSSSVWAATATYLKSSNSSSDASRCAFTQTTSEINGTPTIFCFSNNGLVAYSTGYWLGSGYRAPWNTAVGVGTTVTFQAAANGSIGKYNLKFVYDNGNGSSSNRYLYADISNLYSDSGGSTPSGANTEGYNFELEAVDNLPITIGEAGFSSLYSPVALTVPAGLTAYVGTIDGDKLILTATDVIPAEAGVILQGEPDDYELSVGGSSDKTSAIKGSVATILASSIDGGVFTLTKDDAGKPTFRGYTGTNLNGFKGYIEKGDVPNNVKSLSLDFYTDAISALQAEKLNQEQNLYDLNGRKVQRVQQGVYIVNGRKVIIK